MSSTFLGLGRAARVPKYDPKDTTDEDGKPRKLKIMVMDVDYVVKDFQEPGPVKSHDKQAVLRMFGVTETGASVVTYVNGFAPYCLIKPLLNPLLPPGKKGQSGTNSNPTSKIADLTLADLEAMRKNLNRQLKTPEDPSELKDNDGDEEDDEDAGYGSGPDSSKRKRFGGGSGGGNNSNNKPTWQNWKKPQQKQSKKHTGGGDVDDGYYDNDTDGMDGDGDDGDFSDVGEVSDGDREQDMMNEVGDEEDEDPFANLAGGDYGDDYEEKDEGYSTSEETVGGSGYKKPPFQQSKWKNNKKKKRPPEAPIVRSLTLVDTQSIYGYTGGIKEKFIRVETRLPKHIPKIRALVEGGLRLGRAGVNQPLINFKTQAFEANVDYALRFMVDRGIVGMGWVEIDQWTNPQSQHKPGDQNPKFKVRPGKEQDTTAKMAIAAFLPGNKNGKATPSRPLSEDKIAAVATPPAKFDYNPNVAAQSWAHKISDSSRFPRTAEQLAEDERHPEPEYINIESTWVKGLSIDTREGSKVPKFRTLGMDIECAGRNGHFPEAEYDPVITICNHIKLETGRELTLSLQLGDTNHNLSGSDEHVLLTFESEKDLLLAWARLFKLVDPDFAISYNGVGFDFKFMLERAEVLGISHEFACLGRVRGEAAIIKEGQFSSKAFGASDTVEINLTGRNMLDVLIAVKRDLKLGSYTLNAVSEKILKDRKIDLSHEYITPYFHAGPDKRRDLVEYCKKDARLPVTLAEKLMIIPKYVEMARVTGTPFNWILTKGQQIKVMSQLLRKCKERNYVVPSVRPDPNAQSDGKAYAGATVIEPERGYYDKPIATLDFNSLYPSIMMAHNLSYETHLEDQDHADRYGLKEGVDYAISPNGDRFILKTKGDGILPEILANLLDARAVAKKDLKKETDPERKVVLDGRQNALKVSANSIYGFTGALVGKLPNLAISASVTAYGRVMLYLTKELVTSPYLYDKATMKPDPTRPSPYAGCQVIYGDTDSVMIMPPLTEEEHAIYKSWRKNKVPEGFVELNKKFMTLFKEAAAYVSQYFIKPINLEFEKIYFPYLLINKKRYSGCYWTQPEAPDKQEVKGLEMTRRDGCNLQRNIQKEALRIMNEEVDIEKAVAHVKFKVGQLRSDDVPWEDLIITKAYARAEYKNKQPHVELVKRKFQRDPMTAEKLGSRIPYIIKKDADKKTKLYMKSEDPIWMLEHGEEVDIDYYVERQLRKPISRVFEPFLKDKINTLFSGDHNLRRVKNTHDFNIAADSRSGGGGGSDSYGGDGNEGSSKGTGILRNFAKRLNSCQGCKASIPANAKDQGLCDYCDENRQAMIMEKTSVLRQKERVVQRLWANCQDCVKDHFSPDRCGNFECPVFYRRYTEKAKLKKIQIAYELLTTTFSGDTDQQPGGSSVGKPHHRQPQPQLQSQQETETETTTRDFSW